MKITRLTLQKRINELFWKKEKTPEEQIEYKELEKEAWNPRYRTMIKPGIWIDFNPEYKKELSRKSSNKYYKKNEDKLKIVTREKMREKYQSDPEYRKTKIEKVRKYQEENKNEINQRNRIKTYQKKKKYSDEILKRD